MCPHCTGDGQINNPGDCHACGGLGNLEDMHIVYGENIFQSYEILECIDSTEHSALTKVQKDGVFIILSCGLVDLNDGKVGKVNLWNLFGTESTTVANLTELLI